MQECSWLGEQKILIALHDYNNHYDQKIKNRLDTKTASLATARLLLVYNTITMIMTVDVIYYY